MRILPWALAALALLSSCGENIQTTEAVREGVLAHLKTRSDIDLTNMTVDVSSVSFRKDEADATVTFRASGAQDAAGTMAIQYTLEAKDGKWAVKARKSGGAGDPHGAPPPGLPPGHPPAEGAKP